MSKPLHLNFADDETEAIAEERLTGFRLQRLEVWNWGTFHGQCWKMQLNGESALLTGDIGSGKSTLVDALTTLLLPRSNYNKAAGADRTERSARSYVLGHHRSEFQEETGVARPVPLRNSKDYSVLLAVFRNLAYDQCVTLAQVLWLKDAQNAPERLFVVADQELAITEHFSDFGGDIPKLRKRLRDLPHTQTFQTFVEYAAAFNMRFHIQSELADQAWDLFHQTVSMKSVGNLTEFVRSHMLEKPDVAAHIRRLLSHFHDLSAAHARVLTAKRQIEQLAPLVDNCDLYQQQIAHAAMLRTCRAALSAYFANTKRALIAERLTELQQALRSDETLREQAEAIHAQGEADVRNLEEAIRRQGGDRLQQLQESLRAQTEEVRRRTRNFEAYGVRLQRLGMQPAPNQQEFDRDRERIDILLGEAEKQESRWLDHQVALGIEMKRLRELHAEQSAEIASLQNRTSNIHARLVDLRSRMCVDLQILEKDLPFAGELLQVKASEAKWRGAIERVLRGFATSLLVPDARYAAVSAWVDRTDLRGRLFYHHVRTTQGAKRFEQPGHSSLIHKMDVKQDALSGWVDQHLQQEFDLACCLTTAELAKVYAGVTLAGQIKFRGGSRHLKDDSTRLDDRSLYVLGWSNQEKIAELQQKRSATEAETADVGGRLSHAQGNAHDAKERGRALSALQEYHDFRDLDWQGAHAQEERLQAELIELEATSDVLKTLRAQKQEANDQLRRQREAIGAIFERIGTRKKARDDMHTQFGELATRASPVKDDVLQRVQELQTEVPPADPLAVESCDGYERQLNDELERRMRREEHTTTELRSRIEQAMQMFCQAYRAETQEFGVRVDAEAEYRTMLHRLKQDDLPRFEQKFTELLHQESMTEVGRLQNFLNQRAGDIQERIETINDSLMEITYNRDGHRARYIRLVKTETPSTDVRQFREDLRACTQGAVSASRDASASEAKFLQVKALMDRFAGRPGLVEEDKRWTSLVTDVRHWFTFSASERWCDDDREHEHYADSMGKSGGQKEKLAYTVLAAGLAYQFGLEWFERRSQHFRFVVIDEAFGRGSEESARYGLELFRKLKLQLLIVTPLAKINVIEPYVRNIGFVANPTGSSSVLRNISIDEHRQRKQTAVAT